MKYLQNQFNALERDIQKKVNEDRNRIKRVVKMKINDKDPFDRLEAQSHFNKQSSPFKNKTMREKERIYVNQSKKPINKNAFAHEPSYSHLDKEIPNVILSERAKAERREKVFHVSPCVLNQPECNLESRVYAKLKHKQTYNSVLKVEEDYFTTRAMNDNFVPEDFKYRLVRENIEEVEQEQQPEKP